jgi:DNA-binding FadR family transcriptional regulator
VAEHRQIFEAIRRGDAEVARHVMAAHLSSYIRRDWPEPNGDQVLSSGRKSSKRGS